MKKEKCFLAIIVLAFAATSGCHTAGPVKGDMGMVQKMSLPSPVPIDGPDPMIKRLMDIAPLPQPVATWPWCSKTNPRICESSELMQALSDTLRMASLSMRWADADQLAKYAAINDVETYHLMLSPFHGAFTAPDGTKYGKWTKSMVCLPAQPFNKRDIDYFQFIYAKAMTVKSALGKGQPYYVTLDHEINMMPGTMPDGGCDHRVVRLNIIYHIMKYVFKDRTPVVYYNHHQWTDNPPRNWNPLPPGTLGDMASCSNYYNAKSKENWGRFEQTVKNNTPLLGPHDGDIGVWLAIGGEYLIRDYTPRGVGKKSANILGTQQLGEAWWLGFHYISDYARNVSGIDGSTERARVFMWPEPLRPHPTGVSTDNHFVMFLMGAHNIRMMEPLQK